MTGAPAWQPLSTIWSTLPWSLPLHERGDAITNAIRGGEVAVRGKRWRDWPMRAFDRIESQLTDATFSIFENGITACGARWSCVEADADGVAKWVTENAMPHVSEGNTKEGRAAAWLRKNYPTGNTPQAKVMIKAMEADLGIVSSRTLVRAKAMAFQTRR